MIGRDVKRSGLRALPGELTDWERLYSQHHPRVLSLCRLLLADQEEAREVAQEVFVKAFECFGSREEPRVWAAWLTTVAVNACRDKRRSVWWKRWRGSVEEFREEEHSPRRGEDPEGKAVSQEQCRLIWREFLRLPPRQREVFVLRSLEQWPTDEVARTLGLNPGTVKRHLFRAIRRLRKALRVEL